MCIRVVHCKDEYQKHGSHFVRGGKEQPNKLKNTLEQHCRSNTTNSLRSVPAHACCYTTTSYTCTHLTLSYHVPYTVIPAVPRKPYTQWVAKRSSSTGCTVNIRMYITNEKATEAVLCSNELCYRNVVKEITHTHVHCITHSIHKRLFHGEL